MNREHNRPVLAVSYLAWLFLLAVYGVAVLHLSTSAEVEGLTPAS
jgi:hypothetical protein